MCTPTHLYITLAITVATFAWLNKPSKLGELSVCEISMGCLFVLFQLVQIMIHSGLPQAVNHYAHLAVLLAYFVLSVSMFAARWKQEKSAPPNSLVDDD